MLYEKSGNIFVGRRHSKTSCIKRSLVKEMLRCGHLKWAAILQWAIRVLHHSEAMAGVETGGVASRRKGSGRQRFTTQVRVVRVKRLCWYLQASFVASCYRKTMLYLVVTTARTLLLRGRFVGQSTPCLCSTSSSLRRGFEYLGRPRK